MPILVTERGPCAEREITVADAQTDVRIQHPTESGKVCVYQILQGPQGPRLVYERDEVRVS